MIAWSFHSKQGFVGLCRMCCFYIVMLWENMFWGTHMEKSVWTGPRSTEWGQQTQWPVKLDKKDLQLWQMFQSSWSKTKIGLCNVMAMGTHNGDNQNSDDPPLPSPYVLSHFLSFKRISGGSRHPAAALRPTAPILQSTSGLRVTLQLQSGVSRGSHHGKIHTPSWWFV